MAGTGPGFEDPPAREVLAELAQAVERHPATRKRWFDVASIADRDKLRPLHSWSAFRRLPLADAEFGQIARKVPPYLQ